jgi:hypothetical protein
MGLTATYPIVCSDCAHARLAGSLVALGKTLSLVCCQHALVRRRSSVPTVCITFLKKHLERRITYIDF